jgi:hypothetical protein
MAAAEKSKSKNSKNKNSGSKGTKKKKAELKRLTETAHENKKIPITNITRGLVRETNYPHTKTDRYDGIVFIVGHSQFEGDLCHLPTKRGMKHHTLLVANIDNTCPWFTDPEDVDGFIRSRFSQGLSYQPTNIEDLIYTVKDKIGKHKSMAEKIKDPVYKKFFVSRGKLSVNPYEYCEREWQFFSQDEEEEKLPEGRVMLLRRDEKGRPYFTVLYENKIRKANFTLKKSDLFEKLYAPPFHLRNVLLVDFGCTNTSVPPHHKKQLLLGRF